MLISQVCAAARYCFAPRIINACVFISIFFISASVTFGATLVVPAGGDLQAAINAAAPGDTIILEAGATYRGPFILPKKTGDCLYNDPVFKRPQKSRDAFRRRRVACLRSCVPTCRGDPIIRTAPGAHHYKLIGLDISTFSASDFIYDLVRLGRRESN